MKFKRCAACGHSFRPHPRVSNQAYCSAPECQRERRRRWQRDKMQSDPDYRDNQARAQQAWGERNPEYWRRYRETHPEYVERNRAQQRQRNVDRTEVGIAKMDASGSLLLVPSGIYELRLVDASGVAKMDALRVTITVISATNESPRKIAKR
ncbi:MAG TPA: hypothetical protein VJ577_01795 [Burkholderiaceae bacterium]|nr:hypothetical protein [Burkholderiaceae bacterium]